MDQLRAIRAFARIIDEGSFAKAARALDLAPAVVTRLIAELEAHLGARLINRTTRRLVLTDAGEAYLQRVRRILIEVEEADALAGSSTSEPRGLLRVLLPPAFAVHQIAKHLPRFRARFPRVTLEFSVPGPVETVDENFDVTILMLGRKPLAGDFVAWRLARSEVILCAAPDYLDRRGRPQHPHELAQHDSIMPTLPNGPRELTFHRGGGDAAGGESITVVPPIAILDTNHIDTNYAVALAGMGITGLPSFVAEDALLEHALERVLPQWHLLDVAVHAATPTRKYLPARTRAFIDFLVETFGGEDADPWLKAAGCETPVPAPTPTPTPDQNV
ncbi:MAG: LysR family transcriptional regulator [Burkholderiaceae bacterium]|nr:LysR family transcriptional regulator [Burkholderiaceae bacterium]